MSKIEFLSQLSSLLSDLSPEEREEALSYYREYIDDAGLENEEAILQELGSVEELAVEIKKGLANKEDCEDGTYRPFQAPEIRKATQESDATQNTKTLPEHTSQSDQTSNSQNNSNQNNQYQNSQNYSNQNNQYQNSQNYSNQNNQTQSKDNNTALVILGVVCAILLAPIWIPLVIALFAVLFAIVITILALIVGIGIAGVACAITGIFLFILAITMLFSEPLAAIALVGASFIVAAIGILFLVLTGWFCAAALPWILNCISKLFHSLFHRSPKEAHA